MRRWQLGAERAVFPAAWWSRQGLPDTLYFFHISLFSSFLSRLSHRVHQERRSALQQRVKCRNWGKSQDGRLRTVTGEAIEAYFPCLPSTFGRENKKLVTLQDPN
jgi:hypothetical protein